MKIESTGVQQGQTAKAIQGTEITAQKSPQRTPALGDRVEVSDQGRSMQIAHAALKNLPAIRTEKVAQLKAAIQNGTYHVSGEAIAQRMLEDNA